MTMLAGLDVGGKRTAVCVMDDAGRIFRRGAADKVGLESGPFTPHLFRSLAAMGYPMGRATRAADAIKSRRAKSDKGDA